MITPAPTLFRAHSIKYLTGPTGVIPNPNLERARRPRDMPYAIHQFMIKWFMDNFGVDYRGTSLFCTGDASIAAGYVTPSSTLISLEPLGDYSVCFSEKCKDLFGYYMFNWRNVDTSYEKIQRDMDSLGFVHARNEGLYEAAASGNEVMLVAKQFRYHLAAPVVSRRL